MIRRVHRLCVTYTQVTHTCTCTLIMYAYAYMIRRVRRVHRFLETPLGAARVINFSCLANMCINTFSLDHKNLKVSLAVYFADCCVYYSTPLV